MPMTEEGLQRCIHNATEHRFQFVCTPGEFVNRYGWTTPEQAERLSPYIVLCNDGMIRPR